MHDYIYEHQQALDDENLEKYEARLGLDLAKFKNDMSTNADVGRICDDFKVMVQQLSISMGCVTITPGISKPSWEHSDRPIRRLTRNNHRLILHIDGFG
jgi:protein-disulfide isomerase